MGYKMEYRETETAPENKIVCTVWGEESQKPEYGTALKLGNQWYIYGQLNPHANRLSCAKPDGWLPKDRKEWTKAEKTLCDILALHPELKK
ncbi:MAG: hypothetical protein PHF86_03460 [Candidatus Nanoarchaeia archaeon]|nr:hypothetical protein [Candidatus Nanoarchaeia archaeon]